MKHRIVTNSAYLALSNALQFALAFLTGVLVGRLLGTEALGIYGLASAIGQIAFRVAELGMPPILTRMLARAEPEARRRWAAAVALRLWSGLAMIVAVELFALAVGYAGDVQLALALYGSSQVVAGMREIVSCAYLGTENMGRIAIAAAAFRVSAFASTAITLLLGFGVAWAIASLLVGQVVSLAIVLRGPIDVPRLLAPLDWAALRATVRESYPLALAGILAMINFRVDAMILSTFVTDAQLGIYNAAFSVIIGLSLFPSSVLPAVFPVFARRSQGDARAALGLYWQLQALALLVGVACATVVYVCADVAMSILYGAEFTDAAPLLRILCWSVPCTFVAYTRLSFFNATNRQASHLVVTALAAVTNVTANLVLIPRHGATGAAWATVASEAVLLAATLLLATVWHRAPRRTSP